jgi:septum formation protein
MVIQQFILGSQSPRRKEILEHFSLPFEQVPSTFDEESVPLKGDPGDYVCEISSGKAKLLQSHFPKALILTADTIVWKNGKAYGKPKNREDAFRILTELSGEWHTVFTGLTLVQNGRILQQFEETRVLFNPLSEKQIQQYLSKLHWADKAGAYAIQAAGGLIIQKIEGCYYNVLGLPINSLRSLLSEVGIDLWAYIK